MFSRGSKIYISGDDEDIDMRPDIELDRDFENTKESEDVPALLMQSLDEVPHQSGGLDQAQLKFLLKQVAINRRYEWWNNFFTYEYMKESMKWFLDTASCDCSFTVRITSLLLLGKQTLILSLIITILHSLRTLPC